MQNPLIDQGTLNRLRGSVQFDDNPALNVTASFVGKEGLGMALEGNATDYIDTQTGAVTSPNPYMKATVTINLLRTQALANSFKQKMETDARVGTVTVRTDANTLQPYQFINCSIQSVRELRVNGEDAGYAVTIGGYYIINNNLWNI